jgi:co-chaperonin GroES (HSP10)
MKRTNRNFLFAIVVALVLCSPLVRASEAKSPEQTSAQAPTVPPVGTIKSINGKTITLTTDAGTEVTVQVQDDAKVVRIAPGEKSLKNATPLQFTDLQVGDRILVRGMAGPDGKTILAASVIAMKQGDIATKQAHDREEWTRHGVGGLVTKIDLPSDTIVISTNATGAAKEVTIHISKQTVLRRYASDSIKFDDAKPAAVQELKLGDQLRARGTRSPDGTELTADEIVSGTFRNIAGTINSIDSAAGTLTVNDLATKKQVTVKIGGDAQLRKLPPTIAQVIAVRLKGGAAGAEGNGNAPAAAQPQPPAQPPAGGQGSSAAAQGQGGRSGAGTGAGRGDMQQIISRLPAVTLADLQKGDAVMIVSTEGTQESGVTAITLLAGVEPILQASPAASSILTPWSMSGAPGGDASP